ncbi:taste receptor type 2 member 40-like [Dendrobates tinctorius]|uniref:taste receptor type 2 member 40-like n=1 Tax=Dendrobates tinctorius TaxID=92724 RepID=UPI003CC9D1D9
MLEGNNWRASFKYFESLNYVLLHKLRLARSAKPGENDKEVIFTITVKVTTNSEETLEVSAHFLGLAFQETALRQKLPKLGTLHYISRFDKEYLLTSIYCLVVHAIFLYRYWLIPSFSKKVFWLNWKSEKTETSSHTMLPAFVLLSLTALAISTVIGFFTNSFIIVTHGMDRAKGRNINPRELILFTLGLFNIAYQFSMVANDTVLYLWSDLYFSDNVYTIFSVLLLFTIFSSFWFTLCLCGFYYVMLVTFEKTLFMRLKQNISDIVPWMLLSSVFLSLFISVPVTWNIKKDDYTVQYNENVTDNSTTQQGTPHMSLQYLLVTSLIGCCIPLVLVAISNILIIKTLCLHAKHLGKNTGGMSMQSVEASVSAARTVTSLLLLYISLYVSQILLIMAIFDVDSIWFSVCLVVIYAYSPVQSIILILGSPKLKSSLGKFLNSPVFRKKRSPSDNMKAIA